MQKMLLLNLLPLVKKSNALKFILIKVFVNVKMIQVGLLTDFGLKGPYVSELKCAVLEGANPSKIEIVDISHSVEKHSILEGAYVLYAASRSFAKGSIILGVVDPGVGTERKAIIVKSKSRFYVGPDNGLLIPSARADGNFDVFEITIKLMALKRISEVFHGRDVFAKAVNLLIKGKSVEQLGEPLKEYVNLDLFRYEVVEDELKGIVLFIDDFGNVITNISSSNEMCKRAKYFEVLTKERVLSAKFVKSYGFVAAGELLITTGSHGLLEIAVNRGSANEILNVRTGDVISLRRRRV